jgi:hypothetical protein
MEVIIQIGISVLGLTSVVLIGIFKNPKWGCLFGLLAEPFWFLHAWDTNSWGIGILALAYLVSWIFGIKNYWLGGDNESQTK